MAKPPEQLAVTSAPLSDQQQDWIEAAASHISEGWLRDLIVAMTSIPSPTGEEGPLAEFVVEALRSEGVAARYQPIDDLAGNVVASYGRPGDGPDLLLYAPLDTLTVGLAEEDCPWVGPELRPDMVAEGHTVGDRVVGLGASNPKGHAACLIGAIVAVSKSEIPLHGSLLLGLGAGGMPTNRRTAGQGRGCSFLLEQGLHADFAVIAKPGWTVDWEEVGLCWFRIEVAGRFSYAGSRHRIAYKNPIVDAARVIDGLEEWFAVYSRDNASGLVMPQGNIGAIEGGWSSTASLSPAVCNLLVDVRVSPRTSPMDVKRQFGDAIAEIVAKHPDLDVRWQMVLAIPGTSTPPDAWIVQSCARAWEAIEKRPHTSAQLTSGATDANILRNRGIPTARIGMPKLSSPTGEEVDFAMGMNAVAPKEMARLTRLLVHAAVDTCSRTRTEVGLG